jgi:hypothetical protein
LREQQEEGGVSRSGGGGDGEQMAVDMSPIREALSKIWSLECELSRCQTNKPAAWC